MTSVTTGRNLIGYTDIALDPARPGSESEIGDLDRLGISHYYDGLATFVRDCHTPMTIAVQGDWGSGKTTALNFIQHRLEHPDETAGGSAEDAGSVSTSTPPLRTEVITFDTWLYSQFDLGDELIFSLAREIIVPLAGDSEQGKALLKSFVAFGAHAVAKGALFLGTITGWSAAADAAVGATKAGVSAYREAQANRPSDVVGHLKKMREQFAATVDEFCKSKRIDRVVIVIDNLDRVQPRRAIDILESLKLFFEVPNCVFILAIDLDVVVRGTTEKYGEMPARKARQFFDKIIQVPFAMPVASYDVHQMLSAHFKLHLDKTDSLVSLVRAAVGTNPRAIKRMSNSFELLCLVARTELSLELQRAMVAMICIQTAFPAVHELIATSVYAPATRRGEGDPIKNLLSQADTTVHGELERLVEQNEIEAAEMAVVTRLLASLSDFFGGTDEPDLELLNEAVRLTQATAVDAHGSAGGSSVNALRVCDLDEMYAMVETAAGKTVGEIVRRTVATVQATLAEQGKPLAWLIQPALRYIVLYAADDAVAVASLGPAARPRIASLSYHPKHVRANYGRRDPQRISTDAQPAPAGRWNDHYNLLSESARESSGKVRVRYKPTGYPIVVEISSAAGVDEMVKSLLLAYDLSQTK
ncbi:KAP family P-loop NTPase fold protein [Microbacterium sp. bgisy203]|uniref:KAP family P-loop NTPase fold protein n=1 Tax=Microbacterium sp. bgisy203 TaxID=3413799 RepID=UPI003D72A653